MKCSVHLAPGDFDPAQELAAFLKEAGDAGGIVSFVGVARGRSRAGEAVSGLFLDHHPRLTLRSLDEVAADAARRFDVTAIRIVHRLGDIAARAPIVFVAAASAHRRAAFEAADYLMDRLKTDAVFWKREHGVDGARWIEPTDADRAERARWSD
jgi:molybdopterin synthase catalytic subunit